MLSLDCRDGFWHWSGMGKTELTGRERFVASGEPHRFQAGNPGRPKGARNKLGEAFIADMLTDWDANGVQAIAKVREEKPDVYLKVVASILPKELNVKVSELDELSDAELDRRLSSLAAQLARAGFDLGAGEGSQASAEQSGGVSTLQ